MIEKVKLSEVEKIKSKSGNLRGTIEEGLKIQVTGSLSEDDTQLTKFHGFYQQDNRDLRDERRRQKLEPLYSFAYDHQIDPSSTDAAVPLLDPIVNESAAAKS